VGVVCAPGFRVRSSRYGALNLDFLLALAHSQNLATPTVAGHSGRYWPANRYGSGDMGARMGFRPMGFFVGGLLWWTGVAAGYAQQQEDTSRLAAEFAKLYEQGRFAEAIPLAKRVVTAVHARLGENHVETATAVGWLAALEHSQGNVREAEALYKRSLAIRETVLGPKHSDVGKSLNNLGVLYGVQGRFGEAETVIRRSMAIYEAAKGPDHADFGRVLGQLADIYRKQGRLGEAERLAVRSLAIREKTSGPENREVAAALTNLAHLYRAQGRHREAESPLKRSLAILEKALGPEHPDVGSAHDNLALLYQEVGRLEEAEPLARQALAIQEKRLGPGHRLVGTALNNLGLLYFRGGRHDEAAAHLERGLAVREKALGPWHPDVGSSLNNLAWVALAKGDFAGAADYWRRSTDVIVLRTKRGVAGIAEDSSNGEAQRLSWQFSGLVRMLYRLSARDPSRRDADARETFEIGQWAQSSEAAGSLAQMAARSAKGSAELAGLVRERQDLASEWQAKDRLLIAAKSEPEAKRKAAAEQAIADRLAAIDARRAEIDRRLSEEFPDYAALASPAPVPVAEVQAQLGNDEALVMFLDTTGNLALKEESFVWVVTRTDVRWVRSELGSAAIAREVTALRCGLDTTAWRGKGGTICTKTLGVGHASPLPFDHKRAHDFYVALFGQVQDLIVGKQLLIVPSGSLTQLPFHVLVNRRPASRSHRAAGWLARDHAITVLPAVSSLQALRRVGRPSSAQRPMIGFGNPLLSGPDARYASLAKAARGKQRCPERRPVQLAARSAARAGTAKVETRNGLAKVSHIKRQVPLPETADELCAVGVDMAADMTRDVLLGTKATEGEVKRLSASGELAQYRMVHFATHGLLSGQLDGTHEPGLILTPPGKATEEDDGYLSASEIAALKLDADWVVLSACNTAAGAETSAEALSGLARAFIYAQARALLVSHWEVYSVATVKLITGAVRAMAHDASVGRAEALRRSMLSLLDKGELHEAHPSYWAPFVVVGEGAAAR